MIDHEIENMTLGSDAFSVREPLQTQDSLDQCPMSINTDQNPDIDPKYLSIPIGIDQHWAMIQGVLQIPLT